MMLMPTASRAVLAAGAVLLCVVVPAATAGGQQPDSVAPTNVLPRDVASEVVALFNGTRGVRATYALEIPAARTVIGDVAVLNGPVTIALNNFANGSTCGWTRAASASVNKSPILRRKIWLNWSIS